MKALKSVFLIAFGYVWLSGCANPQSSFVSVQNDHEWIAKEHAKIKQERIEREKREKEEKEFWEKYYDRMATIKIRLDRAERAIKEEYQNPTKIRLGMNKDQVIEYWGYPVHESKSLSKNLLIEIWVYGDNDAHLTFVNNKLTRITNF